MIKKVVGLLKNKVTKNAGWLIFGRVFQMLMNLVVSILTARYLGPSNYGLINYANAYIAFFSSVCTLGINSVLVKEFVDKKGKEGEILGTSLLLRAGASVLSAISIIAIVCVADADEPMTKLVVALSVIGLLFNIFEVFKYWFQSRLQSKKAAIASLIAYSVMSVYKIVLLVTDRPVTYFAVAMSIDYIVIAVLLYIFYRRDGGGRLSVSGKYGKELLKKSYHFILPGLMIAIYGQTDKLMLKQMVGEAETGYYATASGLCTAWCFVLGAIIDSLTPVIMEEHKRSSEKYDRLNRLLYCIVFYVSTGVSVLFCLFGDFAIALLYGEAYAPAAAPLKVITWYTAFSYLGVARNVWLVCEDKQKYLSYVYVPAAIANVVLNLMFIPIWGATGAAVASLVAQIITSVLVPLFIRPLRKNSILMLESMIFKGVLLPRKR